VLLNGRKGKHPTAAVLPDLKRHGAGAYTLRAVFATLARGAGTDANLDAVILGQRMERSVLQFYLRGDMLSKLRIITEHVRVQVWPSPVQSPE
jgi:hypothetical protein